MVCTRTKLVAGMMTKLLFLEGGLLWILLFMHTFKGITVILIITSSATHFIGVLLHKPVLGVTIKHIIKDGFAKLHL